MGLRLAFEQGTITVEGDQATAPAVPHTEWDDRTGNDRALGFRYAAIRDHLDSADVAVVDTVLDLVPCPELSADIELRPYQQEALDRWLAETQGALVLPTGSGKTYVGMQAIDAVNAPAFVVVPTLDLVDQWIDELQTFDVAIGEYTGREKQLEPITVSTYDSAYNHAEDLGNRFKLVVFDEVHHLAAEGYRHIAEFFAAPCRMGSDRDLRTGRRETRCADRPPRRQGLRDRNRWETRAAMVDRYRTWGTLLTVGVAP